MSEYLATDIYGRPIGKQAGTSDADKLKLKEMKDDELKGQIASAIEMASTIYGGFNLASSIGELGFKEALKQTINPLSSVGDDPLEALDLFSRTENPNKIMSLLPDVRDISERFTISPDVMKYFDTLGDDDKLAFASRIRGLFDDEQLSRLDAKDMLSAFNI